MDQTYKTWCVYQHINKTNKKCYIGITCLKPEKRWNKGNGYKRCPLFYRAIQKYGWDNFEHIILYDDLSEEEAINKEIELIRLLNSNDNKHGYNLSSGGEGTKGVFPSKETLIKMRINNTGENSHRYGKHHSEETRRLLSKLKKGKKLSDKHRESLSKIRKGANNPNAKKIYCFELDKFFDYIELAAKELNLQGTHISAVCKGKRNTTGGYHFIYTDDIVTKESEAF